MKKIIYNIKKAIVLFSLVSIVGIGGFTSCNDYLDVDEYIDQMTSIDSVFTRKTLLLQYLNGAAGYLPHEGKLWSDAPNPFQGASDENFTSWKDDRHAFMKFLLDEITPFSNYYNNYASYYQGIRMAYTIIQRIDEVPDITPIERRDYIGRCRYLIGYYYYLLLQQYGPVPIAPEIPFKPDDSVDKMSLERGTYEECIAEIHRNMTIAAEYLLLERQSDAELSIPTSWAALAVLSRISLYAASPWYNGNQFYADWVRASDGAHFIPQQKDNSKWGTAAAYSKYIIESGNFQLYYSAKEADTPSLPTGLTSDPNYYENYPQGAGGIDPFRSFSYIFNGEVPVSINKEIILSCGQNPDQFLNISSPWLLGGWNGLNLTHDLAAAFYMNNGLDINDPVSGYPDNSQAHEAIGGANLSFSGYSLSSNAAKMYVNREMRFYATIGFCHAIWPGTSYTGSESNLRNVEVTYYSNGTNNPKPEAPNDYNRTGYTCKKYIHPEDNAKNMGAAKRKYFPIVRYAEILLNYVEAINELEGVYTMDIINGQSVTVERNEADIVKYFNQIRYRAGLPGITLSDAHDPENIRKLIKRERHIEFACEGRRYHDLRRWGQDAMDEYNRPVTGMNIKATSGNRQSFYTVTILTEPLARRTFSHKNYFWPIPKGSLNKNPKLTQNPGW